MTKPEMNLREMVFVCNGEKKTKWMEIKKSDCHAHGIDYHNNFHHISLIAWYLLTYIFKKKHLNHLKNNNDNNKE